MDVTRPDASRPEDDEPLPPRGRRWRWMGFVALLLIVALAVAYFTWSKRSETRLDEFVAELRRAGEPTEPHDLVHPPIPAEDDAAPDLLAAAAALDQKSPAFDAFNKMELDGPLGSADRATIAKLVEAERDVLEKVHAARGKRDADWRIPYQSPTISTLLPHLHDLRNVGNVSRAAAIHERLRGNDGAALEHLRDVLAVGEAADSQPVMVGHLVAIGVRAVAVWELVRMAPGLSIATADDAKPTAQGPPTGKQVREAIRELLDEARADAGFVASLRGERVLQLDTARLVADRKLDLRAISGAPPGSGFSPPAPRGLVLTDARLMAEYVTGYVKAYEGSPDYPTFRAKEPPIPGPIRTNPKLHFFASILMPSYGRFVTQQYRGKAERRLAATALALRLYAADHGGSYPKTLDELVPNYLPAVPTDPFATGSRPLKYSAADPAAPSVYSVGEDGADDGGSTAPVRSRQRASNLGRWDTKDAVLQMKASTLVMSEEEEAKRKAADRDE